MANSFLKRTYKSKHALAFRKPFARHPLQTIPEDEREGRTSVDSAVFPSKSRDITPSSTLAVKRGSFIISTAKIILEDISGEDYLCRVPPRRAPLPPSPTSESSAASDEDDSDAYLFPRRAPTPSSPTSSDESLPLTPHDDCPSFMGEVSPRLRTQHSSSLKKRYRAAVVLPSSPTSAHPLLSYATDSTALASKRSSTANLDEYELVWIQDESEEDLPTTPEDVLAWEGETETELEYVLPTPFVPLHTGDFEAVFWEELRDHTQAWLDLVEPSPVDQLQAVPPSISFSETLPSTKSYDPNATNLEAQSTRPSEALLKSKFSSSTLGSNAPKSKTKSKWKGGKLRLSFKRTASSSSVKSPTALASPPYTPMSMASSPFPKTPSSHQSFSPHPFIQKNPGSPIECLTPYPILSPTSFEVQRNFGKEKRHLIPPEMFLRR